KRTMARRKTFVNGPDSWAAGRNSSSSIQPRAIGSDVPEDTLRNALDGAKLPTREERMRTIGRDRLLSFSLRWALALVALGAAMIFGRVGLSSVHAAADRPAISRSGVLGGASYLIEAPANWQGGLVVFAHGIQRGPGPGAVAAPPMASHIVDSGHAWAASGYRAREYQPHLFIEDTNALRELFLND